MGNNLHIKLFFDHLRLFSKQTNDRITRDITLTSQQVGHAAIPAS
jgi:hypothetical protein